MDDNNKREWIRNLSSEAAFIVDPDDNVSGRVVNATYAMVEEFAKEYARSRAVDVVIYGADGVKMTTVTAGAQEIVRW